MSEEMIAMILAGGRGSRLKELTQKVAKPAVHFGGKYRIIDFPLSNCANSNIGVVGVLTQYESIELAAYCSQGSTWGLSGKNRGTFILSPREKSSGFGLYQGTADAICQNIDFMDRYNPEYVLILSGDHIYKMDYEKMLQFHKDNKADVTIAGLTVTMEEAKRFGIMNTNKDNSIYEFEEKPAQPKNNQASMGIYIFTYSVLREALLKDQSLDTEHDFGKNIIPNLLSEGKRLFAYPFEGYWKDVGTVESLWQSNMDLLDESNPLQMSADHRKIYTEDIPSTPQFISEKATVERCYVNQGCHIEGSIKNSVLFRNVTIEEDAKVTDAVLLPNCIIEKGAVVKHCIVGEDTIIKANEVVGNDDEVCLIVR